MEEVALIKGEPIELATLPPEVVRLMHAVDRMRDKWGDAGEERRAELWRQVHQASDGVWGRFDDRPGYRRWLAVRQWWQRLWRWR
jgi:hypothetical protein